MTYNDRLFPKPRFRNELRRTISAWGEYEQSHLARIVVGVVGCGSVGSRLLSLSKHIHMCMEFKEVMETTMAQPGPLSFFDDPTMLAPRRVVKQDLGGGAFQIVLP